MVGFSCTKACAVSGCTSSSGVMDPGTKLWESMAHGTLRVN